MPSRLANLARSAAIPAALLALAPKCGLCLLAYAGLGAALGLPRPELCGAPATSGAPWPWLLSTLGLALGWFALRRQST